MTDIKADVRTHLVAQTGITGLVDKRVYVTRAPKAAKLPFVVISRAGDDKQYGLSGQTGSGFATIDIKSYDNRSKDAETLAEAVRNEMSGFNSTMGSTKTAVTLATVLDDYEPPQDASDVGKYVVIQTYNVGYVESIPTL